MKGWKPGVCAFVIDQQRPQNSGLLVSQSNISSTMLIVTIIGAFRGARFSCSPDTYMRIENRPNTPQSGFPPVSFLPQTSSSLSM